MEDVVDGADGDRIPVDTTPSIDDLPEDVLLHIFSFLNGADIRSTVAGVSRRWLVLAREEWLWRELCKQIGQRPHEATTPRRFSPHYHTYMTWRRIQSGNPHRCVLHRARSVVRASEGRMASVAGVGADALVWGTDRGVVGSGGEQRVCLPHPVVRGGVVVSRREDWVAVASGACVYVLAADTLQHHVALQHEERIAAAVSCVAWTSAHTLAVGAHDRAVTVWHIGDGGRVVQRITDAHADELAWVSGRGAWLVTCAHGASAMSPRVWSVDTGECVGELHGHSGTTTGAVFLDRNTCATASNDYTIRVWDVPSRSTLQALFAWQPQHSIAYAGGVLATADSNSVFVWTRTGRTFETEPPLHHMDMSAAAMMCFGGGGTSHLVRLASAHRRAGGEGIAKVHVSACGNVYVIHAPRHAAAGGDGGGGHTIDVVEHVWWVKTMLGLRTSNDEEDELFGKLHNTVESRRSSEGRASVEV